MKFSFFYHPDSLALLPALIASTFRCAMCPRVHWQVEFSFLFWTLLIVF